MPKLFLLVYGKNNMNELQKKASQPIGMYITFGQTVQIAMIFTVISIARSFALRRAFNYWHIRKLKK